MSNDAKEKFEAALHRSLADSARRLVVLVGQDSSRMIAHFVAREALLILDKIKLINPEEYGHAMAKHGRDELKKRRAYCFDDDCYNRLVDPPERCEFSPAIQRYLDTWCPSCAERVVQEDKEEEAELSDYDKELLAEMEKELANSDE